MIIEEIGNGFPVAARYALSKWVVLKRPPFEKRCINTGVSGVTEARRAATAGATRVCCALAVDRKKKSFDELRMKIIRAEGIIRLYSTTYLASARGGAFIQKAMKITGRPSWVIVSCGSCM
jgi:hypothetical protein